MADNYLYGVKSVRALLLTLVSEYMRSGFTSCLPERKMQNAVLRLDRRLQNLIETHEAVMPLYVDDIFKRSFLHLQRHQIQSIGLEIRMLFKCLRSSVLNPDASVLNKLLESEATIENILIRTQDIIKAQTTNFVLGMAPLTNKQLSICLKIYQYRAELITLHSFISQHVMIIPGYLDQVENKIYSKGNDDFEIYGAESQST